ncbi:MAG: DUF1697 domain-containing protein [Gorillibacterium sp.]|nr:DUF1697 domain-containing protein [Gorillibacterium sp.]
MTMRIALLRGINVSGQNPIKMLDLKQMFETLGFSQVQTYIQTGNVRFESNEDEPELRQRIQQEIKSIYGFSVPVILRTVQELKQVIVNCPFSINELSAGENVYVALLLEAPLQTGIDRLLTFDNAIDDFRIQGREVYILYRQGSGRSNLTNALIEKKLGVSATTRNWNTVNKLVLMGKE